MEIFLSSSRWTRKGMNKLFEWNKSTYVGFYRSLYSSEVRFKIWIFYTYLSHSHYIKQINNNKKQQVVSPVAERSETRKDPSNLLIFNRPTKFRPLIYIFNTFKNKSFSLPASTGTWFSRTRSKRRPSTASFATARIAPAHCCCDTVRLPTPTSGNTPARTARRCGLIFIYFLYQYFINSTF